MAKLGFTLPIGQVSRTVYAGTGNALELVLWEDGSAFDTTQISRVQAIISGQVLDSQGAPGLFSVASGGRLRLFLGGFDLGGPGVVSLRLRVYDTSAEGDNVNGRVWIDALPVYLDALQDITTVLLPLGAVVMQAPDGQYALALDASGVPYTVAVPDIANPWDALFFRDEGGQLRRFYLAEGGVPETEATP